MCVYILGWAEGEKRRVVEILNWLMQKKGDMRRKMEIRKGERWEFTNSREEKFINEMKKKRKTEGQREMLSRKSDTRHMFIIHVHLIVLLRGRRGRKEEWWKF